jgi:hypothetical protein
LIPIGNASVLPLNPVARHLLDQLGAHRDIAINRDRSSARLSVVGASVISVCLGGAVGGSRDLGIAPGRAILAQRHGAEPADLLETYLAHVDFG